MNKVEIRLFLIAYILYICILNRYKVSYKEKEGDTPVYAYLGSRSVQRIISQLQERFKGK